MKRRVCKLILISSFIILISLCDQSVIASSINPTQPQTNSTQTQSSNVFVTSSKWWVDIIGYLSGPSIIALITGVITIYNTFVERKYELKEISMDLITEVIENKAGYTVFNCSSIMKAGTGVEITSEENKYYYDVKITFDRPPKYKPIFNMAIKQLNLEVDEYVFQYSLEGIKPEKWVKCHAIQNSDTCSIILRPPCVKPQYKKEINAVRALQYPQNIKIYMTWFVNASWRSIWSYIHPRENTVLFIANDNKSLKSIIGIVSEKILKGRVSNE